MIKKLYALAAVALFTAPLAANATMVYGPTGLTGTFTTQNFDTNAGNGTAAASQFSGIVFGAGTYLSDDYNGFVPSMINFTVGNFLNAVGINPPIPPTDPTSFSFTSPVSELAFAFLSYPGATAFSTYLNNVLVETVSLNTGLSGQYVSISGYTFDKVGINLSGISIPAYIIDDMQYKATDVPEPATLALMSLGLAGAGVFRRKAAKKA